MDRQTYKKIRKQWRKPVYHDDPKKKNLRAMFRRLELFAGHSVVDIGCNAGLVTYEIAKHSRHVIGIERDEHYHQQALVTSQFIKTSHEFRNCTVGEFLADPDVDYDAAFAGRVLYHIPKDEIDLLAEQMLPRCKVVVFVSREDKKKKINNPYELSRWRNIVTWLRDRGMTVDDPPVDEQRSNWVSVVGTRD